MSQASEQPSAPVRKTKYYRPAPGYKSLWNQGTINPHIAEYGYLPAGEMAYQGQGWNPGVYQDEPGFKSGGEIDEEGLDEEGTRHFVSIGLVPEDPTPYNHPSLGGGSWGSYDAVSGASENPIMGSGDAGIFDQGSSDTYLNDVLNNINQNQDNNFGVYTDRVYVDPVTGQVLEGYTGDFQTLADYAAANGIDPSTLNSHISIDQMGSPESILKAAGLPTDQAAPADYPVMDALGNVVDTVKDAYGTVKDTINTGASNFINSIDPLQSVVVTGSRYPITSGILAGAATGNPMLGWSTYDFLKNGYQPEVTQSSDNGMSQGYFDENGNWVWDDGSGTVTSTNTGTTSGTGTTGDTSGLDQVVVSGTQDTGTTNPFNYSIDPSGNINNSLLDQTLTDLTGYDPDTAGPISVDDLGLSEVTVTGTQDTGTGVGPTGGPMAPPMDYPIDPSGSIDNSLLDQTPVDFTGDNLDEVTVTGTQDTNTSSPFSYPITPPPIDTSLLDQNLIDFTGDGLDEVTVTGTQDKTDTSNTVDTGGTGVTDFGNTGEEVTVTGDRWTPGTDIMNYPYNPIDPFTPPPPVDFGDGLDEVVVSTDRYKPPVIDYPITPPPVTFNPTTPNIRVDETLTPPPTVTNVPTKPPGGTTTPPGGTGGTTTTRTPPVTQVNPVSRRVFDPVAPLNPVPNVRSFDPSSDAQMNDYYRRMWTGASYEPVLNRAPQNPGSFNQFLGNLQGMVQPGAVQEMAGVNPNSGGITSIGSGTQADPRQNLARGGKIQGGLGLLANTYKAGGRLLRGPGDGMSDSIPAVIKQSRGGMPQRAALADGEFVIPADVVSHLGNGSTEAGSKKLYEMMDRVRHARTGRKAQGKQINPNKFMPK
jgi:hypothetical protein